MENVNKFFSILEKLKYQVKGTEAPLERIKKNLEIIQKSIHKNFDELFEECLYEIDCPVAINDENLVFWTYTYHLYYILLKIYQNVDFESTAKENLISIQHMDYFTKAVIEATRYGIRMYLNPSMSQNMIFKMSEVPSGSEYMRNNSSRLEAGINFLEKILKIQILISGNSMDTVILDAMAGVYTFFFNFVHLSIPKYRLEKYEKFLNYLWKNSPKEKYFKNLLILKSIKQLPITAHNELHKHLMQRLTQKDGFRCLVHNMIQPLKQKDQESPFWERHEIIAKIIANKSHKKELIEQIIPHIFDFIFLCLQDEDELFYIGAGVITLRKLALMDSHYKMIIETKIKEYFRKLTDPDDLLTGIIVMEDKEFKLLIGFAFTCFCNSSLRSLPSEFLIKYLPFLLNLYSQLSNDSTEQGQIKSIIVQCLSNREKSDLQNIITDLYYNNFDSSSFKYKTLHSRISINFNEKFRSYTILIAPFELKHNFEISNVLPKILKLSNNNILIYNVFTCIFNLLNENTEDDIEIKSKIDLLQDETELDEFLSKKFKTRISIISSLTDLITYRQFYSQFHENPREILNVIYNFIKRKLDKNKIDEEIDQNLTIVLAIFQEFLEHIKDISVFKDILSLLKIFMKNVKDIATKHQIETIIDLIENGPINKNDINQSEYDYAKSLLYENQSHLKVYGITQMIKLINENHEEVLANKHAILALAMHILKDEESYTYLNCIRLFVALLNILEDEVFETLSAEYINQDEKIEFRLKIGEAILKITEESGPMAYKYRKVLINCFLNGCRQINLENEFRTSSLSNLGALCKILSYQIYNFFQELLIVVDSILQTDEYLPLRRAAVMVLSQILIGFDNLFDFQDYLIPLYRYLNYIVKNDKDDITRIHASNGLKSLNEKCKKFLFAEQKFVKEINIFGIKDEMKKKTGHILEIT